MLNQTRAEVRRVATHRIPETVSATIEELLKLSSSDRIDIAMALWESLSEEERDSQFVLTDELKAELDRRWEEHLTNPETAIPWEVIEQKHKSMS